MRWLAMLIGIAAAARPHGPVPPGVRVAGRITILEKDGKPSPDIGSAVVYLEGGPAGASAPGTFEITTSEKEFVPRVVVVPVGSTVNFPNHDPFDHNVFSVSEGNQFDLGKYGRGQVKGHTFTSPGLARMFCNIHPKMVSFVQVMASRYYTQPSVDGSFVIERVPPGRYTVQVWHERAPRVAEPVTVGSKGVTDLAIELDARGYHWVAHNNKKGKKYPTNAGRERY